MAQQRAGGDQLAAHSAIRCLALTAANCAERRWCAAMTAQTFPEAAGWEAAGSRRCRPPYILQTPWANPSQLELSVVQYPAVQIDRTVWRCYWIRLLPFMRPHGAKLWSCAGDTAPADETRAALSGRRPADSELVAWCCAATTANSGDAQGSDCQRWGGADHLGWRICRTDPSSDIPPAAGALGLGLRLSQRRAPPAPGCGRLQRLTPFQDRQR